MCVCVSPEASIPLFLHETACIALQSEPLAQWNLGAVLVSVSLNCDGWMPCGCIRKNECTMQSYQWPGQQQTSLSISSFALNVSVELIMRNEASRSTAVCTLLELFSRYPLGVLHARHQ